VNALRRLCHTSSDDLELALLRSAESDAPSARSLAGAALAVGLSAETAAGLSGLERLSALESGLVPQSSPSAGSAFSGAGPGGGANASAAGASLGVLKYAALGVVSGLLVTAGMRLAWPGSSASPDASERAALAAPSKVKRALAAKAPSRVVPPAEVLRSLPERASVPKPLLSALPVERNRSRGAEPGSAPRAESGQAPLAKMPIHPAPSVLPAPSGSPAFAPVAAASSSEPDVEASIGREIALLDQVRRAIGNGSAGRAVALLDRYESMPRSGTLDQEATLLRVRALSALGAHGAAANVARGFLARHPESRHAGSLQALVEQHDAER
jgi:hypothetical protein